MTAGEAARLVAWGAELRAVHARLRDALQLTREAAADGSDVHVATRDLLLLCHGFCTALDGHHRGEDRTLFPALSAAHPELAVTLDRLQQDHSMIGHLLAELRSAVERAADPADLARHLEGIAAIMESHFRFEERSLLHALDELALRADPLEALGPI